VEVIFMGRSASGLILISERLLLFPFVHVLGWSEICISLCQGGRYEDLGFGLGWSMGLGLASTSRVLFCLPLWPGHQMPCGSVVLLS